MKTDRTLEIENKLKYYDPDNIGGFRINKFRRRNYAYEVPVKCGTTSGGLIDFVRVDEILIPGTQTYRCSIGSHKEWYLKNNPEVLKYIGTPLGVEPATKGCVRGLTSIEELPEFCDCRQCGGNTLTNSYDNEVCITAMEIKVTKDDFHSNHGHNFVGNANYYVMPKELYNEVKSEISEDIGVIIHQVTDQRNILRRVKECKVKPLTSDERMWMVLSVLKKQPYSLDSCFTSLANNTSVDANENYSLFD